MKVKVNLEIEGRKDRIWEVITDIEHSKDFISGIQKTEILERPSEGIIGLKWKETRRIYNQQATEIMWITDAVQNKSYTTRAESHGSVYISHFEIMDKVEKCLLDMSFEGQPNSFFAKISSLIFGKMMMKSTEKALLKDLQDIKTFVEES